ncbi:MAG: 3-methyl-2-oxobutanoate hydroxymethyltransferase [Sedimentisphaerales bacterium]|nr:3-methyl-2-oxobutanoate hydroxymethyltransferase [Sedimentisphaerales bacterium]
MADKITLSTLKRYKKEHRKITMLTCYDYSTAVLLGQAGVDSILVGDSLAQVVLGHETTLPASMDIMIELTAAVHRGAPEVYLIGDMPFLSYQVCPENAIINAGRFLSEAGCDAVKLEVDHRHLSIIERLSTAGIPVVAHLGYRPQWASQEDKVVQTRSLDRACQLIQDGLDMLQAGASAILLECVTSHVAQALTEKTDQPVISCGSGPYCDGQVLVLHEVLGMPGACHPKFCKQYADLSEQIRSAVGIYVDEVQKNSFPDREHSYHMNVEQQEQFKQWLKTFDGT